MSSKKRRQKEITSERIKKIIDDHNGNKIVARLKCWACGWRDSGGVALNGAVFHCPRCETRIFGGKPEEPIYFHGGQKGLEKGGRVLPPDITGAKGTLREEALRLGLVKENDSIARGDRVYLVTRWAEAVMYAVLHPSLGQVYLVRPFGDLEPDPDCDEEGLSWQCPEAVIRKVMDVDKVEVQAVFRTLEYWKNKQNKEHKSNARAKA